ncbi:hypothetical protein MNB_SV-6-611 [hydrothermal vent metagenome]|uniref:Uncharacterized protein n=1 Tax=hydrothermal vent metagenome TaxID=652676 RepID=A0A1W1CCD3_9ZZZZ
MLSLVVVLSMVVVDYLRYDRESFVNSIDSVSSLTKISSPSISSSWYEPRFLYLDERENPIYPEMSRVDKMEFVYAK